MLPLLMQRKLLVHQLPSNLQGTYFVSIHKESQVALQIAASISLSLMPMALMPDEDNCKSFVCLQALKLQSIQIVFLSHSWPAC